MKVGCGMHRVLLIGFGFCIFGLVSILGNLIFIPIVVLRLERYVCVRLFARDLVRWSWFLYLQSLRICRIVSYDFDFKLTQQKKLLIIANHPSLLDVVFLLAHIPRANCVVKSELQKNIFLRFAIKASGYIPNTNSEEFLEKSAQALDENKPLILFPEGTRTQQEIKFHKAGSYLAIHHAYNIQMLYIQFYQQALKKGQKWYNAPSDRLQYKIYSLGEKNLLDFNVNMPNPLRVRELHKFLNSLYQNHQKEKNATAKYGK